MIQYARRSHYENILNIEKNVNQDGKKFLSSAWLEKSKFDVSIDNKTVAIVCGPTEDNVDGYLIYHFDKKNKTIEILKLEGTESSIYEMLKYVGDKARDFLYNKIVYLVHEKRLSHQKTISALGGKAVAVKKDVYKDGDAYEFRFEIEE